MKKVVGEWSTEVKLTVGEAKSICKFGQGEKCCAFLVIGHSGFECIRLSYPANSQIFTRLESGTMNAKGEGGWSGCAWEGEI
jgi:hypothetical protein